MNFEFLLPASTVYTQNYRFQKIRTCFKCHKCTGYNRFLNRGELSDKFQPNRFLLVAFLLQFLNTTVCVPCFDLEKRNNNRITLLLFLYNLLQNYIKISCTAILRLWFCFYISRFFVLSQKILFHTLITLSSRFVMF